MNDDKKEWLLREKKYHGFMRGPVHHFWQRRQEGEFSGVDAVPIRYVKLTQPGHRQAIVVIGGRTEGYLKYQELLYDLFHCGYDVLMMDHRGQGLSGRMLSDPERGHVVNFSDYIDDLQTFWQLCVETQGYEQVYSIAHSMGSTILALLLARHRVSVTAAALIAPMSGIRFPIARRWVDSCLHLARSSPRRYDGYVFSTGVWRQLPFPLNPLTSSRVRFVWDARLLQDNPGLRIGGPSYRWLEQAIWAGEAMIAAAPAIDTPVLVIQGEKDKIVDNRSHHHFCQAMSAAGHPCYGNQPYIIRHARHEVLNEKDAPRAEALHTILRFFRATGGSPP
ncbi:MAG: lysophospholipase L2 [Enterobacteriaceae bacterium]